MAAQICETCKWKDSKCYCSPNSTCTGYETEISVPGTLKAHLIQIRRMVQAMNIPNLMDVSDGALREARSLKNEINNHVSYLIKELKGYELVKKDGE